MSFPRGAAGRTAIALAVVLATMPPSAAGAAQPTSDVYLRLTAQPLWHSPGDDLGIRVEVVNASPSTVEGFRLQVRAFDAVRSRSALQASFDGAAGFQTDILVRAVDRPLAPGASATVRIDDPVSSINPLSSATEGGVYPLTIALFDAAGSTSLDELTTQLLFQPGRAEVPLNLALVVPLHELPARGADGVFVQERGSWALEDALAPGGWLEGTLSAVEAATADSGEPRDREGRRKRRRPEPPPPLRLGLAPTPRLIEELADLADGYRRRAGNTVEEVAAGSSAATAASGFLARLRRLLQNPGVQPLVVPYGFPDLPTIVRRWPLEQQLPKQLARAGAVLEEVLGIDPTGTWVMPPAGRLDAASLEQLRLGGAGDATVVSADSLEGPEDPSLGGCPEDSPSFVCPISLRSLGGQTLGYTSDDGLEARLSEVAQGGATRLDIQNFFAETAMIHAERPGVPGRVIQVTVPALWHPTPRFAHLLIGGLARAPWLRSATLEDGLSAGERPVPRRIVDVAQPLGGEPDDAYFESIDAAEDLIEHLDSIEAPDATVEALRRNLLVAQSRSWWRDPLLLARGSGYATASSDAVEETFDQIEVGGVDQITLTSREGAIRLELENRATFPAEIDVRLTSTFLAVDDSVRTVRLAPNTRRELTIDATAEASGLSRLEVAVLTPDGYLITVKEIQIRSTEFNKIALGITLGALAFLIFFYVLRATRRARSHSGASA